MVEWNYHRRSLLCRENTAIFQKHEKEILELRSQGMTLREIGEKLGFTHKEMRGICFPDTIESKENLQREFPQTPRDDPGRAKVREPSIAEYKYEIERLKMGNELLRDFLRSTGREWRARGEICRDLLVIGEKYPGLAGCASSLAFPGVGTTPIPSQAEPSETQTSRS